MRRKPTTLITATTLAAAALLLLAGCTGNNNTSGSGNGGGTGGASTLTVKLKGTDEHGPIGDMTLTITPERGILESSGDSGPGLIQGTGAILKLTNNSGKRLSGLESIGVIQPSAHQFQGYAQKVKANAVPSQCGSQLDQNTGEYFDSAFSAVADTLAPGKTITTCDVIPELSGTIHFSLTSLTDPAQTWTGSTTFTGTSFAPASK